MMILLPAMKKYCERRWFFDFDVFIDGEKFIFWKNWLHPQDLRALSFFLDQSWNRFRNQLVIMGRLSNLHSTACIKSRYQLVCHHWLTMVGVPDKAYWHWAVLKIDSKLFKFLFTYTQSSISIIHKSFFQRKYMGFLYYRWNIAACQISWGIFWGTFFSSHVWKMYFLDRNDRFVLILVFHLLSNSVPILLQSIVPWKFLNLL